MRMWIASAYAFLRDATIIRTIHFELLYSAVSGAHYEAAEIMSSIHII